MRHAALPFSPLDAPCEGDLSKPDLQHLKTFGFVIKRGYLSAEEVETLRREHATALEYQHGHRRDDGGRHWTRFASLPDDTCAYATSMIELPKFLRPAEQLFERGAIGLGVDANRYVGNTGWHNDHSNDVSCSAGVSLPRSQPAAH